MPCDRPKMTSTIKWLTVFLLTLTLALANASSMSGEPSDNTSSGSWFGWFGRTDSQTQAPSEANLQLSTENPSEMTSAVSSDSMIEETKLKFLQTETQSEREPIFQSETAINIPQIEPKVDLHSESNASADARSYSWWSTLNPFSYFSRSASTIDDIKSQEVRLSKSEESSPTVSQRKLVLRGLLRISVLGCDVIYVS